MSDNLNGFLIGIADAIREKTGTTDEIPAQDFKARIKGIENNTGTGGSLNVFAQKDEPEIKDGIWIKTEEKIEYEKIQIVNNFSDATGNVYTALKNVPLVFDKSKIVSLGRYIYICSMESQRMLIQQDMNININMLLNMIL